MPSAGEPRFVYPIIAVGDAPKRVNGDAAPTPLEAEPAWRLPNDPAVRDEPAPTEAITELSEPTILVSHVTGPDPPDPRLVLLATPGSERASAFRLLRQRLLKRGDPRLIAVTSPRPGEGKTTCALNLGLALAEESQTRVLLVDANLLRPSLAAVLGLEAVDGLQKSANLRIYPVLALEGTRLHAAAAVGTDSSAASLDRVLIGSALVDLRTAYDYVVVDTSSVLEAADANLLADVVDGVILVERVGVSRKRDLGRALDQLGAAPVVGAVLLG